VKYKIFISGVQKELKKERRKVKEFIESSSLLKEYFVSFLFEDLPAKTQSPKNVYIDEVKNCDIYLGLLDNEYGLIVQNNLSATELEYNQARKDEKEVFVYIKGTDDAKRNDKIKKFISKIKSSDSGHCYKRFNSMQELESQIHDSLIEFLRDEGIVGRSEFDKAICKGSKVSDLDENKIHWLLQLAKEKRSFPVDKLSSIKNTLVHLNLLKDKKLTNAAICLFGKNVKKFHLQSEVKCIQFYETEIEKPFLSYKIFSGNLFDQIDQSVSFVISCLRMPVIQQKGTAKVKRPLEIPEFVIQEAIVNAIAHRDYNSNGAVQVMVFNNRIEIWNPGKLSSRLTIDRLKKPHTSYPNNPLIAEILYLADYIQKAGSGTLEMIKQCRANKLPEPVFNADKREFKVVLKRKIPKLKNTQKNGLVEGLAERLVEELAESQIRILHLISADPKISKKDMSNEIGISTTAIDKNISSLKKRRIIRRVGSDKGGRWEIIRK